MNYGPSSQSMDRHPHSMDRFHFSILHQSHFRPMCRPSILWASILFYVPLFSSICHYLVLCTIVPFYAPSSQSMCRPPNLWTVIHLLCAVSIFSYSINLISDLCFFILFYGSLSCSMCRYSALCAFILFYGSLSCSMCLYLVLCALVQLYVPSHNS